MGKRIGFIDAMRGLAMLLVVIGHVFYFSVCHLDNAIMRILSDEVEVPLFFMVSGFLVNIPKSGFWKFLGKKAFLLFVPAAVFMALYVWMEGSNYISSYMANQHTKGMEENIRNTGYVADIRKKLDLIFLTPSIYDKQ